MTEDEIGKSVVDVAVQVHQKPGPGLLETVYEVILARGYLLNFSEVLMNHGITRIANRLPEQVD